MPQQTFLEQARDAILESARDRLGPVGWNIRTDLQEPSRVVLHISHELTSEYSVSFTTERSIPDDLEAVLDSREFAVIERAPRDTPHSGLMRSIRQQARSFSWSQEVMESVADVLALHEVLTPAEAEWLRAAGPTWAE